MRLPETSRDATIRSLRAEGVPAAELARRYRVTEARIRQITGPARVRAAAGTSRGGRPARVIEVPAWVPAVMCDEYRIRAHRTGEEDAAGWARREKQRRKRLVNIC